MPHPSPSTRRLLAAPKRKGESHKKDVFPLQEVPKELHPSFLLPLIGWGSVMWPVSCTESYKVAFFQAVVHTGEKSSCPSPTKQIRPYSHLGASLPSGPFQGGLLPSSYHNSHGAACILMWLTCIFTKVALLPLVGVEVIMVVISPSPFLLFSTSTM